MFEGDLRYKAPMRRVSLGLIEVEKHYNQNASIILSNNVQIRNTSECFLMFFYYSCQGQFTPNTFLKLFINMREEVSQVSVILAV